MGAVGEAHARAGGRIIILIEQERAGSGRQRRRGCFPPRKYLQCFNILPRHSDKQPMSIFRPNPFQASSRRKNILQKKEDRHAESNHVAREGESSFEFLDRVPGILPRHAQGQRGKARESRYADDSRPAGLFESYVPTHLAKLEDLPDRVIQLEADNANLLERQQKLEDKVKGLRKLWAEDMYSTKEWMQSLLFCLAAIAGWKILRG
ncbi:hypothetical protein K458DRAFT_409459 [Lentithecium fluviatile CBS 122367]|uniref:Uncharacterized protein n=1 Tax=Lentithecium fluviatile CBS 122367 TaxID=1168545 RepID=A0A6G1IID9_9PLEO|nr:hypothetical protein K458DRAFT_409459 [Lentithecium fluviatile CBS 122367]